VCLKNYDSGGMMGQEKKIAQNNIYWELFV